MLRRGRDGLLAISALRGAGFAVLTVVGATMTSTVARRTGTASRWGSKAWRSRCPTSRCAGSCGADPAGIVLRRRCTPRARWLHPRSGQIGLAAGLQQRCDWAVLTGVLLFGAGYGAVLNLRLVASFARAGEGRTTTASSVWNASFDAGSSRSRPRWSSPQPTATGRCRWPTMSPATDGACACPASSLSRCVSRCPGAGGDVPQDRRTPFRRHTQRRRGSALDVEGVSCGRRGSSWGG